MALLTCSSAVRSAIVGGLAGVAGPGLIVLAESLVLFDIIDLPAAASCRWAKGARPRCDSPDTRALSVDGLPRGGNGSGPDLKISVLSLLRSCDGRVLASGGFGGPVELVGLLAGLLGGDGGGCPWFSTGCSHENLAGAFMSGRTTEFLCKALPRGSTNTSSLGVDSVSASLLILMGVWAASSVVSMNEA